MRFTGAEFFRGAIAAWVWFLVLHQLALLLPLAFTGWIGLWVTVPWSLGALVVGAPVAYAIGMLMRRQSRIIWHLVAFSAFGLGVGAVTTCLAVWLQPQWLGATGFISPSTVLVALSAAPAVALGWWHTARRALAVDRGPERGGRIDVDAETEDALIDNSPP
ncbi:hypothetical protein [Microbacterium lushaniae]|uniref:Uncharacterized protein n=1 Tax=Microbacterium lushaniae TaxID=2614639 RepID=A0A5J6L5L9_9MICO|nr:hypothetical protein [Microbacterium lushaniae]QEW03864.1 hypothetical protein F6J85_12705 [Microbacterium lushaniae]